jgi:hypothetical protein
MASTALAKRCRTTCRSCASSHRTAGSPRPQGYLETDFSGGAAIQDFPHPGQDLVEIHDFRLEHLLPAEGEQLAGQAGGPFPGLEDLPEVGVQVRTGLGLVEA